MLALPRPHGDGLASKPSDASAHGINTELYSLPLWAAWLLLKALTVCQVLCKVPYVCYLVYSLQQAYKVSAIIPVQLMSKLRLC